MKVVFYKFWNNNNIWTFLAEMFKGKLHFSQVHAIIFTLFSGTLFWCSAEGPNYQTQSGFHILHFRGTEVWDLAVQQIADTNFSFNHSWDGTRVSVQFNFLALTFPSHWYFWWLW